MTEDVNQQIVNALLELRAGDILIRNGDITVIPHQGNPQTFRIGDFGASHLDQMALIGAIRDYFAMRASHDQPAMSADDVDRRILELLDNPFDCEVIVTFSSVIVRKANRPVEILRRIGSDVKGFGMWSAIKTYFEWIVNHKDEHGLFRPRSAAPNGTIDGVSETVV